jgi:hypothetical protein
VYKVKIVWKLGEDNSTWWNQAAIWIIEEYGLPGDRYSTELTEDYLIYKFLVQEDAAMTALRWGNN